MGAVYDYGQLVLSYQHVCGIRLATAQASRQPTTMLWEDEGRWHKRGAIRINLRQSHRKPLVWKDATTANQHCVTGIFAVIFVLPVCQPGRCNMTRTAMMSMSVYPHQRRPSLAFVPERIGWKGMISSANRRNPYSRIKQPFVYSVDFKQQIKKTFRETTLKGLLQSNYKLDITAG